MRTGSAIAIGVLALAPLLACRSARPAAPASGKLDVACKLEPERVRCTATNGDKEFRVACVAPYVGNKRTAALIGGDKRACSMFVEPGKTESFDGLPGFRPADVCGPDLAGCELRMFDAGDGHARGSDETIRELVAFVRQLERSATELGIDHPTLAECEELRKAWVDRPDMAGLRSVLVDADLSALFCVQMGRQEFDCLRAARTAEAMNACPTSRLGATATE